MNSLLKKYYALEGKTVSRKTLENLGIAALGIYPEISDRIYDLLKLNPSIDDFEVKKLSKIKTVAALNGPADLLDKDFITKNWNKIKGTVKKHKQFQDGFRVLEASTNEGKDWAEYDTDEFFRQLINSFWAEFLPVFRKEKAYLFKKEDKGYSGYKSTGRNYEETKHLDIAEIAKLIREQYKIEFPEMKWSVRIERFSGGQAIRAVGTNFPENPFSDEFNKLVKEGKSRNEAFEHFRGKRQSVFNEKYTKTEKKAQSIMQQYNMDDSDAMTDYFHVKYYGNARIEYDDWERKLFPGDKDLKQSEERSKKWDEAAKKKNEAAAKKRSNFFPKWAVVNTTLRFRSGDKKVLSIITKSPNGFAFHSTYDVRVFYLHEYKNGDKKPVRGGYTGINTGRVEINPETLNLSKEKYIDLVAEIHGVTDTSQRYWKTAVKQITKAWEWLQEHKKELKGTKPAAKMEVVKDVPKAQKTESPKVIATKKEAGTIVTTHNKQNPDCVAQLVPLSKINTDTKRFQNRKDAYSEASAQAVAQNFDANKFDPIVLWHDKTAGKDFVISGHSRLEGMQRRKAKEIPARYFTGSEKEAIKFAKVEANRSANAESFIEDLKAYQLMRDGDKKQGIEPVTRLELQKIFKGRSGKLEYYSFLNPNGLFIQVLSQDNLSEYPHIESRAAWVGELAKNFPKEWSKAMERNLFYFFYRDKKNLKILKKDFMDMAEKRLNTLPGGQQILFPECTADGCDKMANVLNDKLTGDAKKELLEVNELIRFVRGRLKTTDRKTKVWTKAEEEHIKKVLLPKLEKEVSRIKSGIKDLQDNQGQLFGLADDVATIKKHIAKGKDLVKSVASLPADIKEMLQPLSSKKQDKPAVYFNIPGDIGRFLGNIERKPVGSVAMTLDAPQGAGKTRFLLQLANALAEGGNTELIASLEEHPESELFRSKVKQYIKPGNETRIMTVDELENFDQLKRLVDAFDVVIIDSASKIPGFVLDDLRKQYNGKLFIVIYQRTTNGTMRGGSASAFDGDLIAKIEKVESNSKENYVYWNKNRYLENCEAVKYYWYDQRLEVSKPEAVEESK